MAGCGHGLVCMTEGGGHVLNFTRAKCGHGLICMKARCGRGLVLDDGMSTWLLCMTAWCGHNLVLHAGTKWTWPVCMTAGRGHDLVWRADLASAGSSSPGLWNPEGEKKSSVSKTFSVLAETEVEIHSRYLQSKSTCDFTLITLNKKIYNSSGYSYFTSLKMLCFFIHNSGFFFVSVNAEPLSFSLTDLLKKTSTLFLSEEKSFWGKIFHKTEMQTDFFWSENIFQILFHLDTGNLKYVN